MKLLINLQSCHVFCHEVAGEETVTYVGKGLQVSMGATQLLEAHLFLVVQDHFPIVTSEHHPQ